MILLGIMIVGGALMELIGVTAILPFMNIAVKPDSVYKNHTLNYFYNLFGMTSPGVFLALLAIILVLIYVIKNIYLSIMNYLIFKFNYNNQRKLAVTLLGAYLKQPYLFFVKHNSADLIRNVSSDTSMLFDTILSTMELVVEGLVCSMLLVFLFITDKSITIGVGIVLILFMLILMKALKRNLGIRGERVRGSRAGMSKWLLQTFGGIKETKIMERDTFFLNKYDKEYKIFSSNHCVYQTLSYLPKPIMESLCIGSILCVVAIKLMNGVSAEYFVSTVSVFALAAFRLLPAFNRIMSYMSRIMFNKSGVEAVYNDLREVERIEKERKIKETADGELIFKEKITVSNVSFRYPETIDYVLKNVCITIPKNKSVAFIGPSGAGKTTLADIILGILQPESGKILVDEKDIEKYMSKWHSKIGYIPQTIYLMDDTIRNNIAFAIDGDIDEERLSRAIEEAQLKEFISTLDDGVDTYIGEQGVRLSGGQRQRIGIARALYSDPEILVLDEATSALDNETEAAVMDAINHFSGKKTLIIIAHRLSTIENCDIVYKVDNEIVIQC